jgi:hypothetical protein
MERTDQGFSQPIRAAMGFVGACAALLGLFAGTPPARAHAPSGAGLRFSALRVQASPVGGSPALSRVRDGQKFWIVAYVDFDRPRTALMCGYAIAAETGSEANRVLKRDTTTTSLPVTHGQLVKAFNGLTFHLPNGVSERTYVVHSYARLNGVIQTRTTRVTVIADGQAPPPGTALPGHWEDLTKGSLWCEPTARLPGDSQRVEVPCEGFAQRQAAGIIASIGSSSLPLPRASSRIASNRSVPSAVCRAARARAWRARSHGGRGEPIASRIASAAA